MSVDQQILFCVLDLIPVTDCFICSKCEESKDFSHFSKSQLSSSFKCCKSCRKKSNKAFKEANPGYMDMWRYDLSVQDKEELIKKQGGTCANENCQYGLDDDHKLYVDHCHKTGKVRGLLCHHCNAALGLLMESPDKIEGLMYYAKKHSDV